MQLRLSTVPEQMEMAVGFHEGWLSLSWLKSEKVRFLAASVGVGVDTGPLIPVL